MATLPQQRATCFVCDSDAAEKAVCLSIERTDITKTSFPRKLSQLIGDDFMVVVSEDDLLCGTCVSLLNRLDKLEVDLNEIKDVITGFLFVKYNLNIEEDSQSYLSGTKCSPKENETKDTICMKNPVATCQISHENQQGTPGDDKNNDSFNNTLHCGDFDKISLNSDLKIKSEPHQCKCSNMCTGNCSDNSKKPSVPILSEALLKKLPEEDNINNRNSSDSNINFVCSDEDSRRPTLTQDLLLIDVKKEKSSDCNLVHIRTNNDATDDSIGMGQLKFSNEFSLKKLTTLEMKHNSSLDEKPSEIQLSLCAGKELPPISHHVNFNLKRVNKPLKIAKHKRNNVKVQKYYMPRKLRPILPKLTNLNDILASLSITQANSQDNIVEVGVNRSYSRSESVNTNHSASHQITLESPEWVEEAKIKKIANKKETTKNVIINKETRCKVCNMNFESLKELKNHNKEHLLNEKMYKCHFCRKMFKTRSGAHNHEAVHTGKFSFCCDICGLCFTTRGSFEEHRSSHTKEERFICDVCGKKFNFQSTYWIHRKWHDNPYPYKCNDCGRLFKHTSMLSVHRRKHTGERPYKCSYCPLTFNVSNTLKRHLILHTKKYPYSCEACRQGFTTRFKFTEHMAKTHNIFIDRPTVEKKDYKVAVYDNEMEHAGVEQLITSGGIEDSEVGSNDAEISDHSFPELSQSIEEIVLGPSSVLSDHSLSLTDSWLT